MFKPYIKSNYIYTANFCEENIWHFGKSLIEEGVSAENLWVLFFSNDQKKIPLFCQQASVNHDPVIWDYHVVLLLKHRDDGASLHPLSSKSYIFDFDSKMPFPSLLVDYVQITFQPSISRLQDFQVYIRQIPLKSYHQRFHSDRSHMLNEQGKPLSPFPKYDPIVTIPSKRIQIKEYGDMSHDLDDGSQVFHHKELSK